jgi:hypothetical protein
MDITVAAGMCPWRGVDHTIRMPRHIAAACAAVLATTMILPCTPMTQVRKASEVSLRAMDNGKWCVALARGRDLRLESVPKKAAVTVFPGP